MSTQSPLEKVCWSEFSRDTEPVGCVYIHVEIDFKELTHMTGRPWWLSRSRICHNVGNLGSVPGLGRSPGEGNGYLLQYSGLENSMDCRVHGVAKSQTQLSKFHFHMIVGLAILQFEGQTSRLEAQGRAELAT